MLFLCSGDSRVRARWQGALSRAEKILEIDSYDTLRNDLKIHEPELVFLHLDLPGLNRLSGTQRLRRAYPELRVFTLSNNPDDKEGLALLRMGVRGYANVFINPKLLSNAAEIILGGEVWVGQSLITSLIGKVADVTKAQNRSRIAETLAPLTPREQEIAELVSRGASNKQIASSLGIRERTVKTHLGAIFTKTRATDRLQLALLVNGYPTLKDVS